ARGWTRFRRAGWGQLAALTVALIVVMIAMSVGSGLAAAEPVNGCRAVDIPVRLPGIVEPLRIAGTFCTPGPVTGRTVQVLVPGYTYSRAYWDFPYRSERYSYVSAAVRAGYATLNIDRLGTGESSHPAPPVLRIDNQILALHQVVSALRRGEFADTAHSRVITIGHSLGSAMVSAEAARFGDVDAVVLTGFAHAVGPGTPQFFATALYPAQLEPRFTDRPTGYLTTLPGMRAADFYAPGTADPAVIATDERLKETTVGAVEAAGIGLAQAESTLALRVPVLVIVGELDTIVCGQAACRAAERLFYRPDVHTTIIGVPGTGHDLNTSRSAPSSFRAILGWCSEWAR
ncbi:MAG: alpha/beta fold hydrolase, partial [Mycobacterium sp.]|nr:alpha/beta fold hydrolase [Mycobacterium sp.]